jgi:hypothetical protein
MPAATSLSANRHAPARIVHRCLLHIALGLMCSFSDELDSSAFGNFWANLRTFFAVDEYKMAWSSKSAVMPNISFLVTFPFLFINGTRVASLCLMVTVMALLRKALNEAVLFVVRLNVVIVRSWTISMPLLERR